MAEIKAFKAKPEITEACQRLEVAIKDLQAALKGSYIELHHCLPVGDEEFYEELLQIWPNSHIAVKAYQLVYRDDGVA